MSKRSHGCAVCGGEIIGSDPHMFVPRVGRVHSGCCGRLTPRGPSVGQADSFALRKSAMISQEPEAAALAFQWGPNFHPFDLGLQRQDPDFCPQGPSQTDLEKFYHQGQSSRDREPPPPLESFAQGTDTACIEGSCGVRVMSEQEQIMFSQASSWTGWGALGKPKMLISSPVLIQPRAMAVAEILNWLGAPTAAAMHAKGEGYGSWSIEDWYAHIREEETKVFSVLLRVADELRGDDGDFLRNAVMKLVADHTAVRNDFLAKGNLPPSEVAIPHGQMEDQILIMHGDQIRRLGTPGPKASGPARLAPARVGDVKYEIVYKAPTMMESVPQTSEVMSPEAFKVKFGMGDVSEGRKFFDPWFDRDAKAGLPWNPLDWFDAKIVSDVPAIGYARIDAMMAEIDDRAFRMSEKKIRRVNYNAAGYALLTGSQSIGIELARTAKGYLEMEADARSSQRSRMVTIGTIAGALVGIPFGPMLGEKSDWMDRNVTDPLIKDLGGEAGHSDWIVDDYGNINVCFTEMLTKLVVPPFGGTLNFGSFEWEEWQNTRFQRQIMCGYRDKWNLIPDPELEPVKAWFVVFTKYSTDADVDRIFMNTGWNAQGLAGDSQVLLVAAPIARLYGFNLRAFAAELWEKSKGWAARRDLTHAWDDGTIDNAGIVQWIVLCKDVFDLATEWKNAHRGLTGTSFIDTPEERAAEAARADEAVRLFFKPKKEKEEQIASEAHQKSKKTIRVLAGGATAAVMAFTGFGLWALAPLAVGIYLGFRKEDKPKDDRPVPPSALTLAG